MKNETGGVRVLLVEDDHDDFILTKELVGEIGAGGYELDWAADYDSGIGTLRRGEHAVCLLDYCLGSRSGIDFLREVRSEGCAVPIIVLTGNTNGSVERDALAAGAADYLVKGKTDKDALWRALRHAVERTRALEALRERDHLFRAVFDGALDAMLIAGDDGGYLDANPAACRITGLTRDELLQRRVHDVVACGSSLEAERAWSHFLRIGRQEGEFVITRPDGQERVVEFSATANIRPGRHLAVLRDVTEHHRLRSRLAMSDRMASVGILAAGVVHEINNPLAAVIANLEVARSETASLAGRAGAGLEHTDLGQLPASLVDAVDAAERVRKIVCDLKLFSTPDEDRREAVHVRQAVESTLRMVWNEIRHRARLVEVYGHTPTVDANESRLGQVFLNLLVNAAQGIPEGNAEGNEIRIVTRTQDNRVLIEISDTGSGIPQDKLERIFEPFYTTKARGVGTGLGLSICHNIVAGLGGELTVASKVGRGSVFRVSLPVGVLEQRGAAKPLSLEPGPERRARILVVDDEPMLVRSISRSLASRHDVSGTTDAREAVRRVAAGERYDVILCDLMMPQMTGMDLHEELCRIAPELADRTVFLTGGAFTPRAREFLDRIPNHRLEKPYDTAVLIALIRDIVR